MIVVDDDSVICGIDEAGRGSIAGPMTVAAVVLPLNMAIKGVRDSKRVKTNAERDLLYSRIRQQCIYHTLEVVDPVEIDQRGIQPCWDDAVTALCEDVLSRHDNCLVVIDGNRAVPLANCLHNIRAVVKADDSVPAVSAASIVAKWYQVLWSDAADLDYPMYGFYSNHGYGTRHHFEALNKFGAVRRLHRIGFLPRGTKVDLTCGVEYECRL